MAGGAGPVIAANRLPARLVALALALLVLGPMVVVATQGGPASLGPADWAAVRFTLMQAGLSALLATALAVPLSRALMRRQFAGRQLLIALLGAPFLLPTVVAAMGLLAVFGRSGPLNALLGFAGLGPVSPYGLGGVLLAHVFLNLPLAARMLLLGWQAIPAERFRLAASLGFSPGAMFRHVEMPMLWATLPGAFATIFALCLTSFAVVLILGGGPAATTIELAIWQAVRFDFALTRAAALAGVQFALCASAAMLAYALMRPATMAAGLDRRQVVAGPAGWRRPLDGAVIALSGGFLAAPLLAVVLRGVPGLSDLPDTVWPAALRSLTVALTSTLFTIMAALVLALEVARRARGGAFLDLAALLPLASSGLVMGTGLFLTVQPFVSPTQVALPVTVAVNTALALPFAYRLLLPATLALQADYGRLADSLGLRGANRLRHLILPRLARPLGLSAGLVAALSMGDLGVIALFAGESGATLPLVIQRLLGAYRMEAAAGASLLLVGLSVGLFLIFDQWGRRAAT